MQLRQTCALVLCCVAMATRSLSAAPLSTQGIAVYGDSLSWQYSLWVPLASSFGYSLFSNGKQFNWVDHLVMSGYNFGPSVPFQTGTYNAYNVALGGATSADLANQVSQAEPFITSQAAKVVVLGIGGNDIGLNNQYTTIYNKTSVASYNPLNDPAVKALMDSIVDNITAAVNATLAENASVKMVMMTVPDIGITPSFVSMYGNAARRAEVGTVFTAINDRIIALANQHHFPVVDLNAMGTNILLHPPTIAGNVMTNTGSSSAKSEYLSDKYHPGTVVQGLLANAILMAEHIGYGDSVTYVSDQTIVTRAGLTATGPSPTYYNVAPYIIYTPVPEPSTMLLAAVGLATGLVGFARRKRVA